MEGINMLWRQHQPHHPYPHRSSCHRCCREKRFACNPGKNTNWISLDVVPQYFGLNVWWTEHERCSGEHTKCTNTSSSTILALFSVKQISCIWKRTPNYWSEIFTSEFHFVCAEITGNFDAIKSRTYSWVMFPVAPNSPWLWCPELTMKSFRAFLQIWWRLTNMINNGEEWVAV